MKDWNIKPETAQNAIYLKEDNGGKGRFFRARFLQPGLVKYSFGVCLLTKETIDKFVYKFVGCPVVIDHKDVSDKNAKDIRVGVISKVDFEQFDGWYWCEGVIFDQEAIDLVNNGYNVSCQYEITQYATNEKKELHNGNEYDKEILDGAPEHLAIVKNPRYESAMIAVNAIDLTASNDKWITVHPNGEDEEGRPLLIKEGEDVKDAMKRQWGAGDDQLTLDLPGAKEAKKDARTHENKKQAAKEKLFRAWDTPLWNEDHKKAIEKAKEALKEYNEYHEEKLGLDDLDDFAEEYEEEKKKEKDKAQVGEYNKKNREADEAKKKEQTYYEPDMEETYTKAYEDSIKKDFDDFMKAQKEKKEESKEDGPKDDVEAKRAHYQDTLKKIKEANKRGNAAPYMSKEMLDAFKEERELKTELTKARREYAESIMDNFEESDNNAYEEKQAARRERYTELSDKASKESSSKHQQFRDKMSAIPGGQPIHGAKDARYREKAWEALGRAVRLGEKADYYADKANSVGKAGISSDDANAIAKLAKKYKSGVDSAEKRRIIDRVIDLHQRKDIAAKGNEDFSDLGFKVERNADINRLQLKFDGKPDDSTRNILKSYGFRWSPREGAWQRQLTGNAEYSLKQVAEKLKANNSFVEEFKNTLYEVISGGIFERLGELVAQNKNSTEKWITIKGNHILLKDGESIADAFKRTTGASLSKGNKYEPKDSHSASESYTKILDRVREDNKKEISREEIITSAIKNLGLNENEVRLKIELAEKYNEGIKNRGLETQKLHSNSNGTYKREREEKHEKILDGIFKDSEKAKPKNGEKPTVIFLGGRGGSGKSKFNGLVYDEKNYIVLDADEIKKQIEEYRGYNAFEVHEESSDILNRAIKIARRKGLNIVLDATMKTLSSTEKKIKSFADDGYNVEMYYMHLPREKAAERAIGRFMGNNGRYVPLEILLGMKENEENFDKLKKYASKWAFYNNDVAKKSDEPILVDKSK
jgi:predicted kinase